MQVPERTILWRVISRAEYIDIDNRKTFYIPPGGMEVKPFTSSYDEAHLFAKMDGLGRNKEFWLVITGIDPKLILSAQIIPIEGNIKAVCLTEAQLKPLSPRLLGQMPIW